MCKLPVYYDVTNKLAPTMLRTGYFFWYIQHAFSPNINKYLEIVSCLMQDEWHN